MTVQRLKVLVFSVLFALSCFALVHAGQKPPVVKATAASIAQGEGLYRKNCLMCHGERGLGDGAAARTMLDKPANLTDKVRMSKLTNDEIFAVITKGRKGPRSSMPPFERKLTETERMHVINYVRTLSK